MKRRLTALIVVAMAFAVVLFAIPLIVVGHRFTDQQAALRLEREAVLAARQIPANFTGSGDPVELPTSKAITFGLYDQAGNRINGLGPTRPDAAVAVALTNRIGQIQQGTHRTVAIPIVDHEHVLGAMRATESTAATDARFRTSVVLMAGLAAAVLLVGAGVARLFAGRFTRPVRELRDTAVRLGDGDFSIDTHYSGIAELDDVSESLTATALRLQDLLSRERSFSADASHQLRTPLAALRTSLEAELDYPRPDREPVLIEALEDITRLETTIEQLLTYARTPTIEPTTTELGPILEALRGRWQGPLAASGRPLVVAWPDDLPSAIGSEALLSQALEIIVDNAVGHGRGEVRVEARSAEDSITITIHDNGPGFPHPMSTIAPDRADSGHGLGLPLARRLIEASGGRLVIAKPGPKPDLHVVLGRHGRYVEPTRP